MFHEALVVRAQIFRKGCYDRREYTAKAWL